MNLRERVVSFLTSSRFKVTTVLSSVVAAMTLAAAGILSGVGLFILMMIQMNVLAVVGSSLLLAVSVSVFLSCYLWLSE